MSAVNSGLPLRGEALASLWRLRIEGWQSSGLSQRAYCDREGFGLSTLRSWFQRLRSEGSPGPSSVCLEDHFMPVSVAREAPRLEVHLKGGHQVCFQGSWDWGQVWSSLSVLLKA